MDRSRLDVALVARGLARSRAQAAAAVREGRVRIDGRPATRASETVADATALRVDGGAPVGRAGRKLAAALDAFAVDPSGLSCLDLGASTGGFTELLLDRGAARIVALDVGHGQLAPPLRADPRVVVVEGENARHLTADRLAALTGGAPPPDLVVADLSFISLTLVLPAIVSTAPRARVICLIKPQFEVGREHIGSGVVRDAGARADAIERVLCAAEAAGLRAVGLIPSPLPGEHGNIEALALLEPVPGRPAAPHPREWDLLAVAAGDGSGHRSAER